MSKPQYTASDMATMLLKRLGCSETGGSREYVVAFEVQSKTGYSRRRLDAVAVNCFDSKGLAIEGFEIKVSKADLRTELQDTSKSSEFFPNLDYFSLIAPAEIIDMSIIPKQWGVYVPDGKGSLKAKRKPLSLHEKPLDSMNKGFAASLLRAMNSQSPFLQSERTKIAAIKEKARKEGYDKAMITAHRDYKTLKQKLERYELLEKHFPAIYYKSEKELKELVAKFRVLERAEDKYLIDSLKRHKECTDKAIKELGELVSEVVAS